MAELTGNESLPLVVIQIIFSISTA
jgi:hypothetical protein